MTETTATRVRDGAPARTRVHWSDDIAEAERRPLRIWFWSVAAMTFAVLVIGGITRLTLSGLSIVDWKPLMGVIPPLNEAQWRETFELYRQFPEYQTWRRGMTLSEFKFIFFWEYLHRLAARAIGLVFLVPFIVFWLRGRLTPPLLRRSLLLFLLGAMQGVLGWLMVKSGLVERPSVSHFRLAAHLSLAFLIFGGAVWLARDLASRTRVAIAAGERRLLLRGLTLVGGLLAVQVVWGAFVAGLKAGRFYPTFPLMGGRLVPAELRMDSLLDQLVGNPIGVQWLHRVLGTLLLLAVLGLFQLVRRRTADVASHRYAAAFAALVVVQYGLGIATLLYHVPVTLGVVHQATAMVIFGVWLAWLHHVVAAGRHEARESAPEPVPALRGG